MKGTFLSFDFVKNNNGDLKFIEMNTDTTANDRGIASLDWSSFLSYISSSGIQEIDVVYKPEIHKRIVNNLSASAIADTNITAFRHHKIDPDVVYPDSPTDTASKFILRMAYDENAIVDSTYCKNSEEPLKLLDKYNSSSLAVPFYYSGSSVIDNLTTNTHDNTLPDVVLKSKSTGNAGVKFAKVTDWDAIKTSHKDDYYITNFELHSSSIANKAAESVRHYAIAHGANLDTIDVGTSIQYGKLQLPSSSITSSGGNEVIHSKHYHEFSTSIVKISERREGLYDTDHFLRADNTRIHGQHIQVGTKLKTYYIAGAPDTDVRSVYEEWTHTGKTLPSGSRVTSASAVIGSYFRPNDEGIVYEVKISDMDFPVYVGEYTSIIAYNSASNRWTYTPVSAIDPDEDYLFDVSGSLVDIEYTNMVVMSKATGSFWTSDVEPTDHLIIDTSGSATEVPIAFTFHNK
jgi:hypothetical protein